MAGGEPQNEGGRALPGPKRAFGRSLADFQIDGAPTPHRLNPAEEKLLICAGLGELCDLGDGVPLAAAHQNRVRAAFLGFLILGGDENAPVHEKGIWLRGAYVEGEIDLLNAREVRSFSFECCQISEAIIGRNASFIEITLQRCGLGRLDFESSHVAGGVFLTGSRISGEVKFRSADVRGDFVCSGAKVENPGNCALACDRLKVAGRVLLNNDFCADGEVRLSDAEIHSLFTCENSTFSNLGGRALACGGARIAGSVFLNNGFAAEGEVRFIVAKIGGTLHCNGGSFNHSTGSALNCASVEVRGNVLLAIKFRAGAQVTFSGARIEGDLDCTGGVFRAATKGGIALSCNGATVKGSVLLCDGFVADGEVRFSSAKVGTDFICAGGRFTNDKPSTWTIAKPQIAADALEIIRSDIAGALWLGARGGEGGHPPVRIRGSLDLQGTYARHFIDDVASWPPLEIDSEDGRLRCCIILDGFSYKRFSHLSPTSAKIRAKWLQRTWPHHLAASFRPQPFEQLVRTLRELGHDSDARRIGLLKESLLRPVRVRQARGRYRFFVWLTSWAWGLTCGYGYRPHRLIVALLALWLACGFLYKLGAEAGGFAPKDGQVWTNADYNRACDANWTDCKPVPGGKVNEIIAFNPYTYSADTLLPAIDLGQRSAWTPMWREIRTTLPYIGEWKLPPGTLRAAAWAENILGVSGIILLGAILSGIVKRD